MILVVDNPLATGIKQGLHAVVATHGGDITSMYLVRVTASEKRVELGMYRLARITSRRLVLPSTGVVNTVGETRSYPIVTSG
jgi:hypothetical protein